MVGSNLRNTSPVLALLALALPASALAQPGVVQNPSYEPSPKPAVIDLRAPKPAPQPSGPGFSELDAFASGEADPVVEQDDTPHPIGNGLVQVGSMVVPQAMLDGAEMVPDATRSLTAEIDPVAGGGPNLEEICAFPDEVPAGIYDYDHRPGGETPRFATIYMNYLGGVLNSGGENSAENISGIARSGHTYPVYGGGEARAIAAAQAVSADFEPWAVRVVYEVRPPKVLPYTMVMMGGHYSDTTSGPAGGVAPLDCEDFGQRNVCYVFQNTSPAVIQANIASQEIGHTLGLGHTNASDSVMATGYAPTQSGDLGFNDSCAETIAVQGQGAHCVGVNRCHCGVPDAQHDRNTLFATFAAAGVDMVEPTIAITSPEDGTTFEPGTDVFIEVDPWDDVGGYGWQLTLSDEATGEVLGEAVDYDRALEFKLTGLPEGSYRATVLIQDHADHTATDEILFSVGDVAAGTSGGSGSGGSDESGGDETGTSGSASGTGNDADTASSGADTDGDGVGQDVASDGDGCGCTSGGPTEAPAFLLFSLPLFFLRRRR